MKTSIKRMCAVGLVTLSLACATGCTAAADTTVPTVSEEQAKSELNQYGNNNGGYNNVQEAEAQYSNDAVSVTVKNGKEHVVSLEDAKKIFSTTVDGKTYSFPCNPKDVLADGWEYSESNSFRTSKLDENRAFENGFGEKDIVFKKGEADEYGTAENEIFLHIANITNKKRTDWRDCTVVGMGFYASETSMANDLAGRADFKTGIGINVGDPIQKVIDLFGCWKYYDDTLDKESDLFGIYVEQDGQNVAVGYVNFFQTDGVITYVNTKLNPNYAGLLSK